MSIDRRVGKKDCHDRYKVYANDFNYKNQVARDNDCLGMIYCKDVEAYITTFDTISNRFVRNTTRSRIETWAKLEIMPNYRLWSVDEKCWYIVDSVSKEKDVKSNQNSRRPIIKQLITIRKGD